MNGANEFDHKELINSNKTYRNIRQSFTSHKTSHVNEQINIENQVEYTVNDWRRKKKQEKLEMNQIKVRR